MRTEIRKKKKKTNAISWHFMIPRKNCIVKKRHIREEKNIHWAKGKLWFGLLEVRGSRQKTFFLFCWRWWCYFYEIIDFRLNFPKLNFNACVCLRFRISFFLFLFFVEAEIKGIESKIHRLVLTLAHNLVIVQRKVLKKWL